MQGSTIEGMIEILNNASGRPAQVQKIQSQYVFRYQYGIARGNSKALNKQTRALVSRGPIPFPDYGRILYENGRILKDKTVYFLRANRNVFK
ncbi:MAG: hypothetical protein JXR71_05750 [Bacteroidales bacterium]|nr:hypothetical protein [Bacteroidales bacterium]